MTTTDSRPSASAGKGAALAAIIGLAALLLTPIATLGRSFDGTAALLHITGQVLSTGSTPDSLPLTQAPLAAWTCVVFLVITAVGAFRRERWFWISGLLAFVSAAAAVFLVKHSLHEAAAAVNELQLRAGAKRTLRNYFLGGGMNIGLFMAMLTAGITFVMGLSHQWRDWLDRSRGLMIPLVSISLSMLLGSVIILLVQPVLNETGRPLGWWGSWLAHADLIYFVYSTLFAPITHLQSLLESLKLATPLIFTGLSVAFAFRAGLFNIGAPGQLTMGALAATLVGVYAPSSLGAVLMPLTILSAGLGGALWGAIPGLLKARFGSSEVINTIMLNYIASGIFIFLIGSNSYYLFGVEKSLPFKAPGDEAQSYELQEAARLPTILQMINIGTSEQMKLSLGWLFGLGVFAVLNLFMKHKHRLWIALGSGIAVAVLTWNIGVPVSIEGSQLNASFLIALACVSLFSLTMWHTSVGYALRSVGLAPKAAEYGGINVAKHTILAMAIAGMFAGLAGTHYVQGGALDTYRLKSNMPTGVGFDGITVALMGQSTPVGVVASSVLIGTLDTGGVDADLRLDAINRDIVTVLKALVVLFIAAGGFVRLKEKVAALPKPESSQPSKDL